MSKRKQIELICPICDKQYSKNLSEYNRNQKLGRESYCSISCTHKANWKNKAYRETKSKYNYSKENINRLRKMCSNRTGYLSPYKYTMNVIKQRCKRMNKEYNLTLEYLKELWESQKGICPYFGIQLQLPLNDKTKIHPSIRASLDRIDSSKGYIKGNVQFVPTLINFMKNNLTHEETLYFIKTLIEKHKTAAYFYAD